MKYAFLCGESACEVLRRLNSDEIKSLPRWPAAPRVLPSRESCVTTQREFKELATAVDLGGLGVCKMPADLLVASRQSRSSGKSACFHVWSGLLPAGSCMRLRESVLSSGPELIILQACGSVAKLDPLLDDLVAAVGAENEVLSMLGLPASEAVIDNPLKWEQARRLISAALLACEFAGTYRLGSGGEARYHAPRLMSLASLRTTANDAAPSVASRRAAKVADFAFDNAASPMEAALALALTLPVEYGGFGLKKPQLNRRVDLSSAYGRLSWHDSVTPDFLWPEERVAVEYDSAEFHGGEEGLGRDAARWNALVALGYRVFRATDKTVKTVSGLSLLAAQIAHALGVGLEEPDDIQALRRKKLLAELMPKSREIE